MTCLFESTWLEKMIEMECTSLSFNFDVWQNVRAQCWDHSDSQDRYRIPVHMERQSIPNTVLFQSIHILCGFYKMLNVLMAKPWLWSPLSGFSVPNGAFNSCPVNFRSHWMGLLFISIVERGVGCLSASFSWSIRGLLQKNTFLSYSAESKESDGLKGWGQHCEWSIVLVLTGSQSIEGGRHRARLWQEWAPEGRAEWSFGGARMEIILLNLLRKVLRLLSWSLKGKHKFNLQGLARGKGIPWRRDSMNKSTETGWSWSV